jgi:SpoVK/Ycf46/Vps4 family AAA+-type ATPase
MQLVIPMLDKTKSIEQIAGLTKGYTPSDLKGLIRQAILLSPIDNGLDICTILSALKITKPSNLAGITKNVLTTLLIFQVPDCDFTHLFGIDDVIQQLKALVVGPFKNMEKYKAIGLLPPRFLLLILEVF